MRAGTIVASNYAAMARLLGESFLVHHPSSSFTVLVVDDLPCDLGDAIDVVRLDDLDIEPASLDVMRSIYDVMEFSTAVKASFLRLLLARTASGDSMSRSHRDASAPIACYLDPDIEVFSNFHDLVEPALDHGIVLTPHALEAVPRDGLKVSEGTIMQSGMYNCGFLAVSSAARPFLDWWDERLRFDAVVDFERSHFTDQRWVDWVPSLFDHSICRDRGMNIAWWNIHERPIDASTVPPSLADSGEPVRFVHFSGYDPARPDLLSKHQLPSPRIAHAPGTGMRTLADAYGARLIESGHVDLRREPYRWNESIDGVELTADVRRRIRDSILAELAAGLSIGDRVTPDAFGGGDLPLAEWLGSHDRSGPEPAVDGADAAISEPVAVAGSHSERASRPATTFVRSQLRSGARRLIDRVDERRPGRVARRSAPDDGGLRPLAFLHVPKSAGSSIADSLRRALPDHRWSEYAYDPAWMGPYRTGERPESVASRVLEDRAALHDADAVAGHLTLPTLLTRFEPGDVATVVREPRCRLLSHYEYWRGLDDAARAAERPWASSDSATRLDFADWLLDESIAYQSDNTLIRQLVDDPAIPDNSFIPNEHLARLARQAIGHVRRLGFVGLVEEGDTVFLRLGEFVGAPLERRRLNVTPRSARLDVDIDAVFDRATAALAARTAGDALVWRAAARRIGVAAPDVLADAAWMRRVGETVRTSVIDRV